MLIIYICYSVPVLCGVALCTMPKVFTLSPLLAQSCTSNLVGVVFVVSTVALSIACKDRTAVLRMLHSTKAKLLLSGIVGLLSAVWMRVIILNQGYLLTVQIETELLPRLTLLAFVSALLGFQFARSVLVVEE